MGRRRRNRADDWWKPQAPRPPRPQPGKFFIPHAKDDVQTAEVYQALKEWAIREAGRPFSERRVFRVEFVHDGEELVAEVGQPLDGDPVIAIFESADGQLFFAARPGRLFLIGTHNLRSVTDFVP